MAAVFPFDTHKFVRKLKSAGFNDPQAEALTEAVQESYVSAELATKADLREYKSAIRNDLEKLETNLRCEINDLRKDMNILRKDIILKLGSLMVAVVTFAPSIIKFLHLPLDSSLFSLSFRATFVTTGRTRQSPR